MLHPLPHTRIVCPMCHLGHFRLRLATYMRQFGETLVSLPNTPVFECDVCHHRQYDRVTVERVEMLVGQVGAPPNRYKAAESHTNTAPESAPVPAKKAPTSKGTKPRAKAKT